MFVTLSVFNSSRIFLLFGSVASKELQGGKLCSLVGRKLPQQTWQREMTSFTAPPAKSKWKAEWINGAIIQFPRVELGHRRHGL